LPPAPPTPNTVIRGFSSRMSGIFKLMLMAASYLRGARRVCRPDRGRVPLPTLHRSKSAVADFDRPINGRNPHPRGFG
jgi:hypothetical protein